MTTLYVFVDECGLPNIDEYFSVGACWCLSDVGPAPTLNETRSNMLDLLKDMGEIPPDTTELKGADISSEGLDTVVSSLRRMVHQDGTVKGSPYPWNGDSRPIRFTYGEVDAGVGRDVFRGFGHDLDTPELLQSMMLLIVLRPLLYESDLDETHYNQVRVVLDSETWKGAKDRMEQTTRASEFEYIIEDSTKAPGIQFADLVARVRRMKRLGRQYDTADSRIEALELE